MKRTLILVFLLIMFFTTAFALPLGVLVREWSCHIVAGDIELPKDKRSVEKESEPEQQEEPEKPEELEADYIPEQLESQETPEEKEPVESFDPAESTPTDLPTDGAEGFPIAEEQPKEERLESQQIEEPTEP